MGVPPSTGDLSGPDNVERPLGTGWPVAVPEPRAPLDAELPGRRRGRLVPLVGALMIGCSAYLAYVGVAVLHGSTSGPVASVLSELVPATAERHPAEPVEHWQHRVTAAQVRLATPPRSRLAEATPVAPASVPAPSRPATTAP